MELAFDLISIRKTLRHGVERGLWTLEQLDEPPNGYKQLVEEIKHHRVIELRSFKVPLCRNLLREHQDRQEAVSTSDPRDFTQDQGPTPAQAPQLPLQEPPALTPFNPEEDNW